jgi:hypothetical protein
MSWLDFLSARDENDVDTTVWQSEGLCNRVLHLIGLEKWAAACAFLLTKHWNSPVYVH